MRHLEWLIAGILIILGLLCLSMAPTAMMGSSMGAFFHSLISVCLWTAIPLLLFGGFYLFYIRKKNQ
ncbi:hypothetical protein [Ammoniphilus sp. 3BR4]|uniref:hypothetical protein n=1 Tax=Ammoniphilus sp. 3BR4 TaxID=3158265 RepID=UPI003466219F